MAPKEFTSIHVAIIGGGITGIAFALGLQERRVGFTLYERNPAFTETGAGIGFSPNAERALKIINPELDRVHKQLTPRTNQEEYFCWVDGYRTNEVAARTYVSRSRTHACMEISLTLCHSHRRLGWMLSREGDGPTS